MIVLKDGQKGEMEGDLSGGITSMNWTECGNGFGQSK